MVLRRLYERFKNQVLRQEIEGNYLKQRPIDSTPLLISFGFLSILLGFATLGLFLNVKSTAVPYSGDYSGKVFLPKGRQYIYIEIEQLFQNSLAYSKSINYDQLSGQTEDLNLADCTPYDYENGLPYYPAGVIANTFFQDEIKLEGLSIAESGIAWDSEKKMIGETSYRPGEFVLPQQWTESTNAGSVPLNTTDGSGLPILNERFVNWVYLSMFPNFRKLWGVVDVPEAGEYGLDVKSNFDFSGKSIYITEKSRFGMKNYLLVGGLLLFGLLTMLSSVLLKFFETE
ncbi:hypothetical protein PAPHI01_0847 [Pancytospora philotis]|nr:hypothetical protein PAPHI01_0847 [Pancytospora philotis]